MNIYENAETGGEGSAGGSGVVLNSGGAAEPQPQNTPNITETPEFKSALADAVSGLQSKNQELIGKQKELKERLGAYDGIDPVETRRMYDVLNKNEEAKLITEGKIDEVLQKRSDRMIAEHNDVVADLKRQLDEQTTASQTYREQLKAKTIDDGLRDVGVKYNVRPEAMDDVLRRARDIFDVDSDGRLEPRRNGELVLDDSGQLMTPERFVKNLRESHPYYFPASSGSDMGQARSHGSNVPEADLVTASQKNGFSLENYKAQRNKTGNTSRYR